MKAEEERRQWEHREKLKREYPRAFDDDGNLLPPWEARGRDDEAHGIDLLIAGVQKAFQQELERLRKSKSDPYAFAERLRLATIAAIRDWASEMET